MNRKNIALICALLLLAQTGLAGCAEVAETSGTSETQAPAAVPEVVVEEETEMTRANIPDDLPELDYQNANLMILAREKAWFQGEMYVEELIGEVVNDAVYNRDINVEDRLNVVVDYTLAGDTNLLINNNVTAGVDEFQIHVGSAVDTVQYGIDGNYYNLLGGYPEYLNLDQPWWSQYYTEQGSILGASFFATGDLFMSLTKLAFVTYANMQMVENYALENPYDMVREGTWTFDNMMQMASGVYVDLNGNGKADEKDQFGYSIAGQIGPDVYWSAFDLSICAKDGEDRPSLSVNQEKMTAVLEKLLPYYTETEYVYVTGNHGSDSEQDKIAQMLSEDRMLFTPLRIMHTDQIRDMESDYALLPLAKWNEEQNNYYTFVHDQYSIAGIPVSVNDPSMVSAVMEAMAADSYRHVTPAYYDLVLNGKYIRDPDTAEMLDIAMGGIKIDFGWIHTYSLNSCSQTLLREFLYTKQSANFASTYKRLEKILNRSMDKLVSDVEAIKEDH